MVPYIIGGIAAVIVALAVGMLLGYQRRKATAEREIGSAEEEATRIVNEAQRTRSGRLWSRPRRRS